VPGLSPVKARGALPPLWGTGDEPETVLNTAIQPLAKQGSAHTSKVAEPILRSRGRDIREFRERRSRRRAKRGSFRGAEYRDRALTPPRWRNRSCAAGVGIYASPASEDRDGERSEAHSAERNTALQPLAKQGSAHTSKVAEPILRSRGRDIREPRERRSRRRAKRGSFRGAEYRDRALTPPRWRKRSCAAGVGIYASSASEDRDGERSEAHSAERNTEIERSHLQGGGTDPAQQGSGYTRVPRAKIATASEARLIPRSGIQRQSEAHSAERNPETERGSFRGAESRNRARLIPRSGIQRQSWSVSGWSRLGGAGHSSLTYAARRRSPGCP